MGRLFWFNPGAEAEAARGRPGHFLKAQAAQMAVDLAVLPVFLSTPEDAVLVSAPPTAEWVEAVSAWRGIAPPRWVCDPSEAPGLTPTPWGASPEADKRLGGSWDRRQRARYMKTRWALLREGLVDPLAVGEVHHSEADVVAAIDQLRRRGVEVVALKAPFGTSGRGTQRVLGGALSASQRGWLTAVLDRQNAVLVEPWQRRLIDVSVLLDVTPLGARILGVTRFATDDRGQYLGAWLADPSGDASVAPWVPALQSAAARAGEALRADGFLGWAGVDAMVYTGSAGQPVLQPLLEVNPRITMGHIALALRTACGGGDGLTWRLCHAEDPRVDSALWTTNDPALAVQTVGVVSADTLFTIGSQGTDHPQRPSP